MWKHLLAPKAHITVIRHGQASYLAEDYDRLSPLGKEQARCLGEYWTRNGAAFDAVVSGPARRHVDTANLTGEVLRSAGCPWPDTIVFDELDEFPGENIVRIIGPVLADRHPYIRKLADGFEAAESDKRRREIIDELFPELCRRWVAAEVTSPEVETWTGFVRRVTQGVQRVREIAERSPKVAVFTSAGPIAVIVSLALGLSSQKALDLAFCSRNTSFSEFALNGEELVLSAFNSAPHLNEPDMLTYR